MAKRVRAVEALRRSKDELRELAAAASSVREQEKSRVARELHDELAQALTALKMDLLWVKERSRPVGGRRTKSLVSVQNKSIEIKDLERLRGLLGQRGTH